MATNESARTALAQREEAPSATVDVLRQSVESMRGEFLRIIGDQIGVDRFVRVALTELRRNPKLAACAPESILGALMTCAQLNLEPGGALGHAWLVPYGDEATFLIGYKGLIKLAWQSGQIEAFSCDTVRTGDAFEVRKGTRPMVDHYPALTGDRGESYAWYAAAVIKGGGAVFEVLGRDDVERIRTRSRVKDGGPWRTDFDAMAKKSAIRQLAKYLPMAVDLQTAVAVDESVRTDTMPAALERLATTGSDS